MTLQVSDSPPQKEATPDTPTSPDRRPAYQNRIILIFLALIGLLILSSSGLLLASVLPLAADNTAQAVRQTATSHAALRRSATLIPSVSAAPTATPPIFTPDNQVAAALQLPLNGLIIYQQNNGLYWVSSAGGPSQLIPTTDYAYNQAVPPILTPSRQILYAGNAGIWLTNIFGSIPDQIASIPAGQVVTSMALSSDGTTIAWSTEPANGSGSNTLYAGPLLSAVNMYQQASTNCPCYHVFGFARGDSLLLLTDDRQSNEAVQYGLWAIDITKSFPSAPQQLLSEDALQGPLVFAPATGALLYSTSEGEVPIPTDNSIPNELASLTYANSLDISALDSQARSLSAPHVVLPEQHGLSNVADYHWITTPVFSQDGRALIYIEFSSDAQAPFDRHSAIYTVQVSKSGSQLRVAQPQLLATSTSLLLELGAWFDAHTLTFYADHSLYALDIHSGAVATITGTQGYARVIAVAMA